MVGVRAAGAVGVIRDAGPAGIAALALVDAALSAAGENGIRVSWVYREDGCVVAAADAAAGEEVGGIDEGCPIGSAVGGLDHGQQPASAKVGNGGIEDAGDRLGNGQRNTAEVGVGGQYA